MFRVATKLGRSAALPEGAWQGAWKQLFKPQATAQRYASTLRGSFSRSIWPHSKTRPGFFRFNVASHGAYRWAVPKRGFRFTAWRRNTSNEAPKVEKLTLGARLKQMSKEYGWTAVGVYLALSALDFPFCFLLVRMVGTEQIGKIEHQVVEAFKSVVPESVRTKFHELWAFFKKTETQTIGNENISGTVEMASWGVEKASAANTEEASLATQLALAYAIHKSFIFIRVPLTAAILPKVVKVLRSWGWKVGKATPKV